MIDDYEPSLRDMIMLDLPMQANVSPDGGFVAFTQRVTNWRENRYDQVCLVCDMADGSTHSLTRTGNVLQMEWVDEGTLALLRSGPGDDDKSQIWLYEGLVGEGWAVTTQSTGVDWFKPFAGGFLYKAAHPERDKNEKRADRFGKFTHFEQEESPSALYYVGLAEMAHHRAQQRSLTESEAEKLVEPVVELSRLLEHGYSIQEIVPSPQGDAVYFTCRPHDDLVYYRDTVTYCITLDAPKALTEHLQHKADQRANGEDESDDEADHAYLGEIGRLSLPAGATMACISPDGEKLLIFHQGRDQKMYTRQDLWVIDQSAAFDAPDADTFAEAMVNISGELDRALMDVQWVERGVYGVYPDGAVMRAARFGDENGQQVTAATLELGDIFPASGLHVNAAGDIGFVGTSATSFPEVYFAAPDENGAGKPRRLTDYNSSLDGWRLGTVETIRWTSVDGTKIEGVLRKPANFDPERRYPLVLVVHGGPQWFSPAYLLYRDDLAYYPTVQFANQDVLVLKPNYRGSLGRGQAFADLNVNNLGVGDLWDIESAVDHLIELGWVDADRVGCMGWSQGGYISAFAGLHSDKFKAVSVGAGISDWYTYHISNDIPDFTTDYLSVSPFRNREIYEQTAPISNLANAHTPMLIQHGSDDKRVPLSNAMELYRGLKEMDVPVELFVYPGFGHPITKPRENHAVMYQNLAWFSHYLLGEKLKFE